MTRVSESSLGCAGELHARPGKAHLGAEAASRKPMQGSGLVRTASSLAAAGVPSRAELGQFRSRRGGTLGRFCGSVANGSVLRALVSDGRTWSE